MSMNVGRKLDELKKECADLGLTVKPAGNKESKTDYILALRNYNLSKLYGDKIPQGLQLMLSIDSPMLAAQSKHLSKAQMDDLWKDNNFYIAQTKLDGVRMLSFWSSDESECDKFSRNLSVKTYLPQSYQENVYCPGVDYSRITHRFLLDSELTAPQSISTIMGKKGVVTETQLQSVTALLAMEPASSIKIQKEDLMDESGVAPLKFNAFDLLWLDGEWLLEKPYIERYKLTLMVARELKEAGVNICIPASTANNKKSFYKRIVEAGGEGVILKDVRSTYHADVNRDKASWLKVKRTSAESLGDTIDGFITGYKLGTKGTANENLVSALEFSTNVIREDGSRYVHVIGNTAGISLELKKQMTEYDENGVARLKSEWYGKCAELDGQDFSARAWALTHCVFVGWRPDKDPDGCSIQEEFIKANVM